MFKIFVVLNSERNTDYSNPIKNEPHSKIKYFFNKIFFFLINYFFHNNHKPFITQYNILRLIVVIDVLYWIAF